MANLPRELVNAEQRYADLKLKTQLLLIYIDSLPDDERQFFRLKKDAKALTALIAKHEAS
jgi:hypothetical protein